MDIARLLIGLLLLVLGRRLFWLFVAVVGFLAGLSLASQFLAGRQEWVILAVAVIAGLFGALLAVSLQGLAVALAGFLVGANLAMRITETIITDPGRLSWLPFVIGGVIGMVLVVALFDWALIILSSLTGAGLITQALSPDASITLNLVFWVLTAIGILIQAGLLRRRTVVSDG